MGRKKVNIPEGPAKCLFLGTGSAQDFAQSCSQKRRKFVLSSKSEVGENFGIKAGSLYPQQDICYPPIVEEAITICVGLQAILYSLRIGNELQHYSLVPTCLGSLAEQLGAIVLSQGARIKATAIHPLRKERWLLN